jgi:hypothetical protein
MSASRGFPKTALPVQPNNTAARAAAVLLIAAGILVLSGGMPGAAVSAAPLQLFYRLSHSVIGDLGSYSCTVAPLADGGSEVRSSEHIDVRMLGIPVYRMDAADIEHWHGDRLLSFHGVTEKAGGRVEISGEARGNRFVITSPQGTLTTAANLHPAQPCAANFLESTAILHPDTGNVEEVRVSGGAPASVVIAGVAVAVRKYVLDGKTRYTVWLDSRNLPVMFAIDDTSGRALFTLARCGSCAAAPTRLGME